MVFTVVLATYKSNCLLCYNIKIPLFNIFFIFGFDLNLKTNQK